MVYKGIRYEYCKQKRIIKYSRKEYWCIGQNFSFIPNEDGEYLPIGEGGTGIVYVAKQYFGSNPDIFSKRAVKFFVFRDDLIATWGYVPKENFIIEIKNISRWRIVK